MQLSDVLDFSTATRVPTLIWGPPGVGKSAAIQRWAECRGLHCWTVIASLREPSDFGGLPIVSGREPDETIETVIPTVAFVPPRFAVEAAIHGGVIFLDELTTAPPAVQAALLRAVVDRAFGDLELDPEKVTLVAAANPPAEAAAGWDLAAPLANRFAHYWYPLMPEAWVEHFPRYWGRPPTLRFGDAALSENAWSRARTLVAAFIRARPGLLFRLPEDASEQGKAWPSPRTWDYCSRLLARVQQAQGRIADAVPMLAGCVGEGAALELASWLTELDLPDPEELLADPESYRHPERGDQAYAVLSAVAQAALGRLTPERWHAAWRVLSAAAAVGGADIAAIPARQLAGARTSELALPVKEIAAFFPILEGAGLVGVQRN